MPIDEWWSLSACIQKFLGCLEVCCRALLELWDFLILRLVEGHRSMSSLEWFTFRQTLNAWTSKHWWCTINRPSRTTCPWFWAHLASTLCITLGRKRWIAWRVWGLPFSMMFRHVYAVPCWEGISNPLRSIDWFEPKHSRDLFPFVSGPQIHRLNLWLHSDCSIHWHWLIKFTPF